MKNNNDDAVIGSFILIGLLLMLIPVFLFSWKLGIAGVGFILFLLGIGLALDPK